MDNTPRTAIVTGAGSGIGRAAALALLADGWQVALAGRRAEPLQQVADESGAGARALAVPTDVTDPQAAQALFDRTVSAFGRVDLLFNNAGIGAAAVPLEDLAPEQWRSVVDVNLNGMFWCLQAAALLRIAASVPGIAGLSLPWLLPVAAGLWAGTMGVWGLRLGRWYGCLRADGRPG